MASERELTGWISASKRTRHRLTIGVIVLGAIGLLLSLLNGTLGVGMLGLTALIAGAGIWITSGHIADWEAQLRRRRGAS